MARLTPQEFADKQISRTQQATTAYADGVRRVTDNPAAKAAAKVAVWQQRVNDPNTRDKFTRSLGRVTLQSWQDAAANKGAPRLSQGVESARPKIVAFATEFLPFQEQVTAATRAMPKGTLEQGLARATAQITGTAKFRRSR